MSHECQSTIPVVTTTPELLNRSSRSNSDADTWWRGNRSLNDIAEHLQVALHKNNELERRLTEVLSETHELQRRLAESNAAAKAAEEATAKVKGIGRQHAELTARERLMRDELERKIQTLELELKRERHLSAQKVATMKNELAGCICQSGRNRMDFTFG